MAYKPKDGDKMSYQLWDEPAFQIDQKVQRMTTTEKWAYGQLLRTGWVCDTAPYLPDDDNELWFMAGCESPEQWDTVKVKVRAMFTPVPVGSVTLKNGEPNAACLLSRRRLVRDWQKVLAKRAKMRDGGRKGGRKSHPKAPAGGESEGEKSESQVSLAQAKLEGSLRVVQADKKSNNSNTVENPIVFDAALSLPSLGQEKPTPENVATEYRLALGKCQWGLAFRTNAEHRRAGVEFFMKHGRQVAIAAWEYWLMTAELSVIDPAKGQRVQKHWLLHEFLKDGEADTLAEKVKPFAEVGAHGNTLRLLVEHEMPEATSEQVTKLDELFNDFNRATVEAGLMECLLDETCENDQGLTDFLADPARYIQEAAKTRSNRMVIR